MNAVQFQATASTNKDTLAFVRLPITGRPTPIHRLTGLAFALPELSATLLPAATKRLFIITRNVHARETICARRVEIHVRYGV